MAYDPNNRPPGLDPLREGDRTRNWNGAILVAVIVAVALTGAVIWFANTDHEPRAVRRYKLRPDKAPSPHRVGSRERPYLCAEITAARGSTVPIARVPARGME